MYQSQRDTRGNRLGRASWLCGGAILTIALGGCGANAPGSTDGTADSAKGENADANALGVISQSLDPLPTLGVIDDDPAFLATKELVNAAPPGGLPSSVDLTASVPSPGNQLSMGSCVGWAVCYAAKSYHEVVEEGWPPSTNNHRFSASWIYNQINFGVDGGSYVSDALDLIVNDGCDTLSAFPYVNGDYTTQPNAASFTRAARFPALSWNTLAISATTFKNELAAGNPIIIAISVLPDFDALNGSTNQVYDSDTGSSRGRHAITIIGYNDVDSTFKFINSWGTSFGNGGYGKIAYSFIGNAKLNMYAYVLRDKANLPLLGDVNGSDCVDQNDYDLLSNSYNKSVAAGANPNADFNHDGWVDVYDYLILTQHWLEGC